MPIAFEKLNSKTLRGQIAERIRNAILQGTLKPGERIVERQLAAQFGASLTAVREALIELETEGFITKRPNAYSYVTRLSLEEIEKVFAVRKVIETHAIREAARLATDEGIARAEKCYLEAMDAARNHDWFRYVHCDSLLHEAIWSMADNEFLVISLRRIIVPLFTYTVIRFRHLSVLDLLADASSHIPLLEAIKARDMEAAGVAALRAMDEWLESIRSYATKEPDLNNNEDHQD